jgi:hypothetical protein
MPSFGTGWGIFGILLDKYFPSYSAYRMLLRKFEGTVAGNVLHFKYLLKYQNPDRVSTLLPFREQYIPLNGH